MGSFLLVSMWRHKACEEMLAHSHKKDWNIKNQRHTFHLFKYVL